MWTTVARSVRRADIVHTSRPVAIVRSLESDSCLICCSVLGPVNGITLGSSSPLEGSSKKSGPTGRPTTPGYILCSEERCRRLVLAFIDSAHAIWVIRALCVEAGWGVDIAREIAACLIQLLPPLP